MVQLGTVVVQSLDSGHIASETLHPRTKLWVFLLGYCNFSRPSLTAIKPRHKMNKLVQPFSKPYFCGARQLILHRVSDNLCMYVCMCVCMYVCVYVCMYVCMYVWYVCMVCMYVCMSRFRNAKVGVATLG